MRMNPSSLTTSLELLQDKIRMKVTLESMIQILLHSKRHGGKCEAEMVKFILELLR